LGAAPSPLLDRLLQDTVRLQLQLENSLFLVNLPTGRLLLEPIKLSTVVDALRYRWPDVAIVQKGDGVILADVRALESVLTNLVQNAATHGRATQISITAQANGSGRLNVRVTDNGRGFPGDFQQLGKLFVRHTPGSGSGVGLYISRQLAKRMYAALNFARGEDGGFVAELDFPSEPGPDLIEQREQEVR